MKKIKPFELITKSIVIMIAVLGIATGVNAYQITSTLDGLPIDVEANFTFDYNKDLITVTINNLIVNPKSIIQNLSGLGFALNIEESPIPTISSSSAMLRDVDVGMGGTYTQSGPTNTGWALDSGVVFPFGSGYLLYVLGTQPKPADNTLIGQPDASNLYSNANGSIGNEPHNPFIYGPAIFEIDFAAGGYDLRPGMNITGVTWYFGTGPTTVVPAPEPSIMLFLGSGLIGLAGYGRKKFFKKYIHTRKQWRCE